MATSFTNGLKDIFLAGVGALAITGEKASEVVEHLIERGELTVDQGKEINQELKHKAEENFETLRNEALVSIMSTMSPEERRKFARQAAEIAAQPNAESVCTHTEAAHSSESECACSSHKEDHSKAGSACACKHDSASADVPKPKK